MNKKIKPSLGVYLLISSLVIGGSIVYYSFTTRQAKQSVVSKLDEVLDEIKVSPSPSFNLEPINESISQETQIQPTEAGSAQSNYEVCMEKLRVFEEFAKAQGTSQEQIDAIVKLGEYKCKYPSKPKTIEDSIQDVEDKVDDLLFHERGY